MSDAKQDFIDDVMLLVDKYNQDSYPGIGRKKLRAFLQERIGEPVAYQHHNKEDVVPASWMEADPVFSAYTNQLYRLDGGHKDEHK